MTAAPRKRAQKKAAAPAQAGQDEFVSIAHCGLTLRIPVGDSVPLEAYIAFSNDDELLGTELLLGEKQWAAFLAKKPTVRQFREIGDKLGAKTKGLLGN